MKPLTAYVEGLEDGLQGISLRIENASKRYIRAYQAGVKRGKAWRKHIEGGRFGWPDADDEAQAESANRTQPVPGNSGGVEEGQAGGLFLSETAALHLRAIMAGTCEPGRDGCEYCAEIIGALESPASTQPSSPQAEVQDCERCQGSGEVEEGVYINTCPDCNGTGKQPPAEPQDTECPLKATPHVASEPQDDVVEVLARTLGWDLDEPDAEPGEVRRNVEKILAAITPLLTLEIRERLKAALEEEGHRRGCRLPLIEAVLDKEDSDA